MRKGDRRKETRDSFAEIGLAICDLEFEIWDFSHLAVYSSETKKNKAENDHWSSVKRLDLKKLDIFIYIIKIAM